MCIGLLIADEKTEMIQIQEQEMKWKLDIYDMINKINLYECRNTYNIQFYNIEFYFQYLT